MDANREFEPVTNSKEIQNYIREAGDSTPATMLWTQDQEQLVQTHIAMYSEVENCFYVWVPQGVKPEALGQHLLEKKIEDCFFSVSLLKANIFFRAKYLGLDPAGYKFSPPEKVFKIQRRKELRYVLSDLQVLHVRFKDELDPNRIQDKKVIDLSAGGLSFEAQEGELAFFSPGLVLRDLTFTLRGREIHAHAVVRYARPLPIQARRPGVKVGVQFNQIKPEDADWISAYVLEETRIRITQL